MRRLLIPVAAFAPGAGVTQLPTVASINLCTDQPVLALAAPEARRIAVPWSILKPDD